MKRLFLILVFAFVALGAWGQEAKPKIAVYTSKVPEIPTLSPMTSQIIKSLLSDYEVVGRAGEFQQLIDKEFGYQSSGKVDDKQLAKARTAVWCGLYLCCCRS